MNQSGLIENSPDTAFQRTKSNNQERKQEGTFSQAKTAPSDPTRQVQQVLERAESQKVETISEFTNEAGQESQSINPLKNKSKSMEQSKIDNENRQNEWAKHNLPKNVIQYFPTESVVMENGLSNFQTKLKGKFAEKLASFDDDKLYKEITQILRKSEGKYSIRSVNIGEYENKEYKWFLGSKDERVISSYSKDRTYCRQQLLTSVLKVFNIDRD